MFKVLILAAQNTVIDERMEFSHLGWLSWLRFLGSRWVIERLTRTRSGCFASGSRARGDREAVRGVRSSAPGERLADHGRADRRCQPVAAPRQRNTLAERAQIKLDERRARYGRAPMHAGR